MAELVPDRVDNNIRKGEKPSHQHFNPFPNKPWFLHVCSKSLLKNTVGKGEIARNEQFLLFPLCFLYPFG